MSRKRVARLMRESGLAGVSRRRGTGTTRVDPSHRAVPDRVERQFQADGPDRIWVADITYVPTWTGFVYLAVVLDVFSRRVVGWSMTHHLRTELVLGVLSMALGQRRPEGVVHHSDKGSQYTSLAFGKRCREMGVLPSTGSAGDCFDNAMAESFFATLIVRLEPSPVLPGAASQRSRHTPRGHPIYRIGRRLYVHRLSPTAGLVATAQTRPLKRGKSSRRYGFAASCTESRARWA